MKLLALDTSTEVMSVAVSRPDSAGQARLWQHQGAGGAQASAGLIAVVQGLLAQADLSLTALDAICFGAGPGAFTGLRTACAVAQGLGFGANVPLLCIDTLLAVAEEARHALAPADAGPCTVTAVMDARMDELYMGHYRFDGGVWHTLLAPALVKPADLVLPSALPGHAPYVAGNAMAVYADALRAPLARAHCVPALPSAAAMLRLAPALLAAGCAVSAEHALPVYVRDKVAKTTQERADEKAAQLAALAKVSS